ncbi:MAG: hypothetical protein SPI77_00550 [Corynebacterium sp.]|nr:hypothetical protein [Corynebacterium sp.]
MATIFADHGVNLHIDAGEWTNIPNYTGFAHGGKTLDYIKAVYTPDGKVIIPGTDPDGQLKEILVNDRSAIFRLGVIRNEIYDGSRTSGRGSLVRPTFIVANFDGMENGDNMRNTLLHEFGHTLGLSHAGTRDSEMGKSDAKQ